MNTLLDTLLRPAGDTDPDARSCITWRHEPSSAVPHLVIGDSPRSGGQWASNPVDASWDIGSLSYADQLSLPGYSLADHWLATKSTPLPPLHRPSRNEVAAYFSAYPTAVSIASHIRTSQTATGITRTSTGFHIASHNLDCRHLVLASGTFSYNLPAPHFLAPLAQLSSPTGPLLVIGSGFTAADIIVSAPPDRKILHIFIWDPEHRPSPLRGCHPQAYPEYAGVYKQMKQAAARAANYGRRTSIFNTDTSSKRSAKHGKYATPFEQRNWAATYEGFPNATIMEIATQHGTFHSRDAGRRGSAHALGGLFHHHHQDQARRSSHAPTEAKQPAVVEQAVIQIASPTPQETLVRDSRAVGKFRYAAGRRGSLGYLSPRLMREVLDPLAHGATTEPNVLARDGALFAPSLPRRDSVDHDFALDGPAAAQISGETLRAKVEAGPSVAPGVFAVGSLTGDSLVRFAYGCCCVVGGVVRAEWARRANADGGDGAVDAPANMRGVGVRDGL